MTHPPDGPDAITIRSFPAATTDSDAADDDTAAWLEAAALSFHQAAPTADHAGRVAASFRAEGRELTGAYAAHSMPGAWPATRPVATYATFVKAMNVGPGTELDTHLIADVTVRATHRRRGLLRSIMSADLRRAAGNGLPLAALRASEATIYGRYGFGAGIFTRHVEVHTGGRFALQYTPAGHVEVADPATLPTVAPQVFDRFHAQTFGSLRRQAFYPSKIAGIWAEDRPLPDPRVRAALHYDPAGQVDGYVSYVFVARDGEPTALDIVDLVAASRDAYLGLWRHLASIDLVTVVRYRQAPASDPLPWAMLDRQDFRTTRVEDGVWLRLLDPAVALRHRHYDVDGQTRIAVSDPLDIATGTYDLRVRDGNAAVTRTPTDPAHADVSMSMSTLSSLYLGGVRAGLLARAGHVVARSPDALAEFDALLAHRQDPYCTTQF
ncbi:MAG: GNAT family N-acetyltransferase [Actinocatenispora sp.]